MTIEIIGNKDCYVINLFLKSVISSLSTTSQDLSKWKATEEKNYRNPEQIKEQYPNKSTFTGYHSFMHGCTTI